MKKNSIKSIIILTVTACIWGFAFVAQVESDLGVLWFNGIRFIIGALSVVPVFLILEREKVSREKLTAIIRWGAVAGCVLFSASSLQMLGIAMTKSSGKSGFITGIYMVLVPLAAAMIGRKKLTVQSVAGAVVALVGLFFVCFSNGIEAFQKGDLFVLAGTLFWTIHILLLDSVPDTVSPIKFSSVQFMTVGIISLILAPVFERNIVIDGATLKANLVPILFCGIMSSGVAYTGQAIGQRGCEAGLASIIMSLESVFAAVGGVLFIHENLGWKGYLGCGLIFAGIVIVQLYPKKKADRMPGQEDKINV